MNRKANSSIFVRLIRTFLIIVVPIYISGVSIYAWGLSLVNKQIENGIESRMKNYLETFENEAKQMKDLQNNFLFNNDLTSLAYISKTMNNYEIIQACKRIQQGLDSIKSSNQIIKEVKVYIASIGKSISNSNSTNDLANSDYNVYRELPDTSAAQIRYVGDSLYFNIRSPGKSLNQNNIPPYLLEIEMSKDKISDELSSLYIYDQSKIMLANFNNGYLLSDSDAKINLKEISKKMNGNICGNVRNYQLEGKQYLLFYNHSDYLGLTLISLVPANQMSGPLALYKKLIIVFTVISAIIMVIFSLSTYNFINQPMKKLVESFRNVEKGNLKTKIEHNKNDEFQYLFHGYNRMVENLEQLIDQVYNQKIMNQRSELKQLQSQINPHFLYNNFFVLKRMVQSGDNESAVILCDYLGKYFQYITRSGQDEISLEKEVNHARSYVEIQSIRFSNRIKISFSDLPEQFYSKYVPRLIIQPLIENVYEHGLKDKISNGLINVSFLEDNNIFHVIVEDNGEDLSEEALVFLQDKLLSSGNSIENTGIINIHRRIQIRFGNDSGIVVSRSELGGLKLDLCIHFPDMQL